MRRALRWIGAPPVPGGAPVRILVAALAVAFTMGDLTYLGGVEGQAAAWVAAAVYLPVLALAVSVRAAALLWMLEAVAGILVLPGEVAQLVAVGLVAVVLNVVITFTLETREWRVFTALSGLYVVVHAVTSGGGASAMLVLLTLLALTTVTGVFLSRYRARWVHAAERVEALNRVQKEVRAEERTAIAHELHDIVAHDITAIVMQARRARFVDDAKRQEILETIGDAGQSTLEDLRRMLLVLRRTEDVEAPTHAQDRDAVLDVMGSTEESATLSAVGLADTLEGVGEALRRAGMEISLQVTGDMAEVPTVIRQSLRRVLRELGTNILKHGDPDSPVTMSLEVGDGEVTVRTRNRIGATAPVMSSGTGVEALKTRVEVYDGRISMGVTAADEWATRIWIPFPS